MRSCGEIILPKEYRETFECNFPKEEGDAIISVHIRSDIAHITVLFATYAPSRKQAVYLHNLRASIHSDCGRFIHFWWSFAHEPQIMTEEEIGFYAIA